MLYVSIRWGILLCVACCPEVVLPKLLQLSCCNVNTIFICTDVLATLQVEQLTEEVHRLDAVGKALQVQQAAAQSKNSAELLTIVERKINARQNRMEDALMQVRPAAAGVAGLVCRQGLVLEW